MFNSDFLCFEFLWDKKVYVEISKKEVLEVLIKVNGIIFSVFLFYYEEVLRDEEEKGRVIVVVRVVIFVKVSAYFRIMVSSFFRG